MSKFIILLNSNARHIHREWKRISLENGVFPFFREFNSLYFTMTEGRAYNTLEYVSERLDLVDYYFGDHPQADMIKFALIYRNWFVTSNDKSSYVMPVSKLGAFIDHYGFNINYNFFKGVFSLIIGSNSFIMDYFNPIYDDVVESRVHEDYRDAMKIMLDVINFDLIQNDYMTYEKKVVVPIMNELKHLSNSEYAAKRYRYLIYIYSQRDKLFMTDTFVGKTVDASRNIEREFNILNKSMEMYFRNRITA